MFSITNFLLLSILAAVVAPQAVINIPSGGVTPVLEQHFEASILGLVDQLQTLAAAVKDVTDVRLDQTAKPSLYTGQQQGPQTVGDRPSDDCPFPVSRILTSVERNSSIRCCVPADGQLSNSHCSTQRCEGIDHSGCCVAATRVICPGVASEKESSSIKKLPTIRYADYSKCPRDYTVVAKVRSLSTIFRSFVSTMVRALRLVALDPKMSKQNVKLSDMMKSMKDLPQRIGNTIAKLTSRVMNRNVELKQKF